MVMLYSFVYNFSITLVDSWKFAVVDTSVNLMDLFDVFVFQVFMKISSIHV